VHVNKKIIICSRYACINSIGSKKSHKSAPSIHVNAIGTCLPGLVIIAKKSIYSYTKAVRTGDWTWTATRTAVRFLRLFPCSGRR
jgi:hypothetical protein